VPPLGVVVSYRYSGLGGHRTPSLSDPRWEAWAQPLLEFLQEARSWSELFKWARRTGYGPNLVRQMIAWAEHFHHAESFYEKGVLRWNTRVSAAKLKLGDDGAPVLGELDEGLVHRGLGGDDGEGEGDDEAIVPAVSSPEDEFMGPPFDDGDG
jgi:hypothetical protein